MKHKACLLTVFLLDITVVEELGGLIFDSLHKVFLKSIFVQSNTCRSIELCKDVVYSFKELRNLQVQYSFFR
jgi:hypothetical protein